MFTRSVPIKVGNNIFSSFDRMEYINFYDVPEKFYIYEYLNCVDRIAFSVRAGFYNYEYVRDTLWQVTLSAISRWENVIHDEAKNQDLLFSFNKNGLKINVFPETFIYEDLCWLGYCFYSDLSPLRRKEFPISCLPLALRS